MLLDCELSHTSTIQHPPPPTPWVSLLLCSEIEGGGRREVIRDNNDVRWQHQRVLSHRWGGQPTIPHTTYTTSIKDLVRFHRLVGRGGWGGWGGGDGFETYISLWISCTGHGEPSARYSQVRILHLIQTQDWLCNTVVTSYEHRLFS